MTKGDKGEVKISVQKGGIRGGEPFPFGIPKPPSPSPTSAGSKMRRNLNQAIHDLQQAKKLANKAIRLSQRRLTEKAEDKIANSLKFIGKSFFWNQLLEKAIKRKNKRKNKRK